MLIDFGIVAVAKPDTKQWRALRVGLKPLVQP